MKINRLEFLVKESPGGNVSCTNIVTDMGNILCKEYTLNNNYLTYTSISNDIYKIDLKNNKNYTVCNNKQYEFEFN